MTRIKDSGMKTRQRRAKMLTGISLLAIIPFLILCTFVYPVNDDFTFGLRHIQKNVFQVSSDIYLYWSGRYFATFISALNPFAVSDNPIPLFRIYSAIAVVLTALVMTLSSAICCRKQLTFCQSAGLGGGYFCSLTWVCCQAFRRRSTGSHHAQPSQFLRFSMSCWWP